MATKRARITDRNPLTATDGVIAGYEQVNKSASQQAKNITSQQVSKPTSQTKLVEQDSNSDNPAPEEASKSTSQLVENPTSTSQEPDNPTSQEVNELEAANERPELDKSATQQVSKPIIRKATFQVDAAILEALDRYHLQLQIEMGRRNAPYKEILVEEAIAQWLERAAKSPDRAVKSLLKRQEQR
jgi:hypothetical protein